MLETKYLKSMFDLPGNIQKEEQKVLANLQSPYTQDQKQYIFLVSFLPLLVQNRSVGVRGCHMLYIYHFANNKHLHPPSWSFLLAHNLRLVLLQYHRQNLSWF